MFEFTAESPQNAEFRRSNRLQALLKQQDPSINFDDVSVIPFTLEKLFLSLNIEIGQVQEFIKNSQLLHELMAVGNGDLLGEEVALPNEVGGNKYNDDAAGMVDMNKVVDSGVDPEKVLVFRISQLSEKPKPELYWQSDIDAPVTMYELSDEQKNGGVILVSTLGRVSASNNGIVIDRMDNNGLSFRQIGDSPFPEDAIMARVNFRDLF